MGSRKGKPNKITKDMKEILHLAFERAGGVDYLVRQSKEEPKAFMALLARIVPAQVAVSIHHQFDLGEAMQIAANNAKRLNAQRDTPKTIDITPEVQPNMLKPKVEAKRDFP